MLTKSIRLKEEDLEELRRYLKISGEVEATALRKAALRGLRELRLERGLLAYIEGGDSAEASEIAGLPRAEFLQVLMDKGLTLLQSPSTLATELEALASELGNERLSVAARELDASRE